MHSFFTMWLSLLARHIYMNQNPDFIIFVVHERISSNKSYYVFCVHNASISSPLAMDDSMKNNRTCVTKILRHSRSWLFSDEGISTSSKHGYSIWKSSGITRWYQSRKQQVMQKYCWRIYMCGPRYQRCAAVEMYRQQHLAYREEIITVKPLV